MLSNQGLFLNDVRLCAVYTELVEFNRNGARSLLLPISLLTSLAMALLKHLLFIPHDYGLVKHGLLLLRAN
jgi:hypothetical protein